jgi:hypothetical protein
MHPVIHGIHPEKERAAQPAHCNLRIGGTNKGSNSRDSYISIGYIAKTSIQRPGMACLVAAIPTGTLVMAKKVVRRG